MIPMSDDEVEERMLKSFGSFRVVSSNLEEETDDGIKNVWGTITLDGTLWIPDRELHKFLQAQRGLNEQHQDIQYRTLIPHILREMGHPICVAPLFRDRNQTSEIYNVLSMIRQGGSSTTMGPTDAWNFSVRVQMEIATSQSLRN